MFWAFFPDMYYWILVVKSKCEEDVSSKIDLVGHKCRENKINKNVKNTLKTFFVFMFFAILNFKILFLALKSFFMNLYFSSRGTCAEEKCEFMKNDFSARNKILKFEIAKNMKTKNVLSEICYDLHVFPT